MIQRYSLELVDIPYNNNILNVYSPVNKDKNDLNIEKI